VTASGNSVDPVLRRGRAALFLAFGAQGFSLIALTSEVPTLQTQLRLSDQNLQLTVAMVPIIAAVGSIVAGILVKKHGSALVLRVAQIGVLLAITGVGFSHSMTLALPCLAVVGFMIGAVDATTNMQGVVLQKRYGRSIMLSFHGVWAVGAAAGSLVATGFARLTPELPPFYLTTTAVLGAVLLTAGRHLLRGVQDETIALDPATGKPFRLPWRPMIAIMVVMTLAYFADSSVSNAGGLFVKQTLHGAHWQQTIVYFAYSIPFLIGRFSGDRLVGRFGGAALGRTGAVIGAIGFAIVASAPNSPTALAGFGVVGLGVSVMAPLCFSAAGRLDPAETGVAVARLNVFNYVGFLLGAGIITGMPTRVGMSIPLVAVALIVFFAYGFDERRTAAHFGIGPGAGTEGSPKSAHSPSGLPEVAAPGEAR
jgi:MFS family permease